jgi:hypothetical protein
MRERAVRLSHAVSFFAFADSRASIVRGIHQFASQLLRKILS